MSPSTLARILCVLALSSAMCAFGAPPIEAFARLPRIRGVSISPDGQRLAYISSHEDREIAVTMERSSDAAPRIIMASDPGRFDLDWCGWANDSRLLCGFTGAVKERGITYGVTRLVSVNPDGSDQKVLLQNSIGAKAQFQDEILDWTPDEPDTVLIELDSDGTTYPTVFELNVRTGGRTVRSHERQPIRRFTTDARGNVRLGYGYATGKTELEYFARLENDDEWRRLTKVKAFEDSDALKPVAIAPGSNRAFAVGDYQGRSALWEMDLTDRTEPQLVFFHPLVDASEPLLTPDGRLLGVFYETDRPFIHYIEERERQIIRSMNEQLPAGFNVITDVSRDESVFVIRSSSDVDQATYYVLDWTTKKLGRLGRAYPELDPAALGRMRSIAYKARDGAEVPGYLTAPAGVRAEKLPLIVMPHGGPISRDSWEFFFLREFLVSRGYAVLQMNFRGSSGYGSKWLRDAHQDWGGLTYSDITDGAQWAIREGIADPKRICIVGWSFGGYAALLGAVRNGDIYRCSASIAGVSDLHQLLRESRAFINQGIAREQIGTNWDKLREDSPLRQIDKISIPVLLIHGDHDVQVEDEHSRSMAAALKKAKKPHRAVFLKNASHQLGRKSDRVTLLTELEKFLLENLGPGVTAGS
ncbi:MAG: alpha/beta hydrolase family protein [Steroidobacter sp.]